MKVWETRDITLLAECFTLDWEFHMHSTGATITLVQWEEFFGNMLKKPDVKNLQKAINKAFYLSLEIPGEKQRFYNNMVDFLEQKD